MLQLSSHSHQRLLEAISHTLGRDVHGEVEIGTAPLADPTTVTEMLARHLPARFVLSGTIERRLLAAEHGDTTGWTLADLSGQPLADRDWPSWAEGHLTAHDPSRSLPEATLTDVGFHRLSKAPGLARGPLGPNDELLSHLIFDLAVRRAFRVRPQPTV